jgi:Ubiquitin-conjugating enzyme
MAVGKEVNLLSKCLTLPSDQTCIEHFCLNFFHIFLLFQGIFKLSVEFNEDYPLQPPIAKFISRMYHPNGIPFF